MAEVFPNVGICLELIWHHFVISTLSKENLDGFEIGHI